MWSRTRLTTAQSLALATAAAVVVVLATAIAVVWVTLTQSALQAAQDGLNRSVRQLVSITVSGVRAGQPRYMRVAEDSAVRALLADSAAPATMKAARTALRTLVTQNDSNLPVELWDANGRRLASVGTDTSDRIAHSVSSETAPASLIHQRGLDSLRSVDSLQIGALQRVGDRTLLWIVLPIHTGRRLIGFVAQRRGIGANPQTEATVRELSGNSARGYYKNVDGTTWTTFGGVPQTLPDSTMMGRERTRVRADLGPVLFAEARVNGAPLVMGMEAPRKAVVAPANATVRRLAILSIALTVIGALLAWLIGWRVTRPLIELTGAAESVARGDYSTRVPATAAGEVGRLASSFNRMASHIDESRRMLEESEAELRTLSDAIPQLAWMANAAGEVFWLNERWYEYTRAAIGISPRRPRGSRRTSRATSRSCSAGGEIRWSRVSRSRWRSVCVDARATRDGFSRASRQSGAKTAVSLVGLAPRPTFKRCATRVKPRRRAIARSRIFSRR